jgi:hypothetical protein
MKIEHALFSWQKGRIEMSVYRKKICLTIICLVSALFVGCGGGSGDSNGGHLFGDPGETNAGLGGDWHGTIRWEAGIDWQVDLSLSRGNNGTYQGSLQGSTSEGEDLPPAEDVTGSVNGSDVIISAVYRETETLVYELELTGTLAETTFSGESAIHTSDNREGHGTFTMTKDENDEPADHESVEVESDSCFTLATGTIQPGDCSAGGDIYFWPGGLNKADLTSSEDIFCPQEGTYTNLESVPGDYSACDWDFYVEGNMSPIDNTGYILRDVSLMHHYKMRVIRNDVGVTTFEYEQID